jgi:hypothetical protein
MARIKKENLFEKDIETQEIDKKIDNQIFATQQTPPLRPRQRKPYLMPKLDRIRYALVEMLGQKKEVIINQVEMRDKLKISLPTWLKHKKTLEEEFEFIRQQRGTILRRK